MFFAKPGTFPPCGMFNYKHLMLFVITIFGVIFAIKKTKIKEEQQIRKRIRIITVIMWILEIVKILFTFMVGNGNNLNKVVPLYYCSLLLYAGVFSSIGKGTIKRVGDVFLATGSIVAGFVFIAVPTTSLPEYSLFHFITIHSFLFHGMMIYLGLMIHKTKYIEIRKSDIKYYAGLILIICIAAYIVNYKYGSNLMFISRDFPGTPITIIYKYTGKLFPIVMTVAQMTLPFYIIYGLGILNKKINNKKMKVLSENN